MRLLVETRASVFPECCSRLVPNSRWTSLVEKDQKVYSFYGCRCFPVNIVRVLISRCLFLEMNGRRQDGDMAKMGVICVSGRGNNCRVLEFLVDASMLAHSKRS